MKIGDNHTTNSIINEIWLTLMKKNNLLFTLTVSLLILGACSTKKEFYNNPQVVADPDKVSLMLAQAADRASTALETLAAIEQTRTPAAVEQPITKIPAELKRGISVNWVGPAENILKTVSDRASYKFSVLGEAPANDIVVSLDIENKPLFDVFRSIGLQLGTRADVHIDSKQKIVVLKYRSLLSQLDPL